MLLLWNNHFIVLMLVLLLVLLLVLMLVQPVLVTLALESPHIVIAH